MATGGKLNPVQKVLKRLLPGSSSREDDRDTGSKVPKQGQIESNVPMECGPAAEEEEQIQPRDSDVRDTEQDPGPSTSEATACQPRDSDVRDTEQVPGTDTSEATACQPRDSDVRDTEQDPGTGTSEATSCQLGNSLNTELSSAQQGVEPKFTIPDLLAEGGEYRLYQLTKFYGDRLKQAIEEKVERLGWILTKEGHFSREENEKVTELTEKGNRTESSRLFLSLVMGKGSLVRRAMWESFVMWRTELPKLDRILREIQELGPDPEEYINIAQGLSELPTELTDVQQKHKETLRAQTETLRVNTILMREKVKIFQLDDRYTKLTIISTLRDRRLVEHELLARGRDHEDYREKHLRGALEKIQTAQLFHSSFSRSKSKSGSSAAVAGVPGIGKTTMVQKIVYDWAAGKIFQQFQFVFSFKFRDLNSINCRINLRELILDQYPYFGNSLREVWKNPEGLLFIFDGLDELGDNKLGDSGVKLVLSALRNPECKIQKLWMRNLTDSGAEDLASAVSTNPSVTELYLSDWELRDSRVKLASAALRNPECKIQKLRLGMVGLTDSGAEDLASALSTKPSLTELDLSYNKLGDLGVKLLSAALVNSECKIQKLRMRDVGLTDSGAEDLASALSTKPSLTELDLSCNKLGDSGVKLVSAALRNPECKIQKLRLYNVGLTDSGAEDLISALSTKPSLTGLDLSDNKLGDSGVKLVSAALGNPECKIQKLL
ncbi:uncharacterized protein [Hemitrygon akajei]|uniref:uncharacterized protein n=1 Tax=Hemitrygon akajei TaxID=2704970 RepID=UPI003BF98057